MYIDSIMTPFTFLSIPNDNKPLCSVILRVSAIVLGVFVLTVGILAMSNVLALGSKIGISLMCAGSFSAFAGFFFRCVSAIPVSSSEEMSPIRTEVSQRSLEMRNVALGGERIQHEMRARISNTTLDLIDFGGYRTSTGEMIRLRRGEILENESIIRESIPIDIIISKYDETEIFVYNQDCLDAAFEQLERGSKKVAVINFAGSQEPGGGFLVGTNGQEENILYRSELAGLMLLHSYHQILHLGTEEPRLYPLGNKIMHTPNVKVFRANSHEEYVLLDIPFEVGILTSSALAPHEYRCDATGDYVSDEREQIEGVMKTRIYSQLLTAYEQGYDTIIAGAFGCGAFRHPPFRVAILYKEMIETYFRGAFSTIVFSVLDVNGTNYQTFKSTFDDLNSMIHDEVSHLSATG